MNFREVREYTHGDDIRFIDWNVSARYAHPFTKVFEEERELTIILLVDISASALFGTTRQRKMDLIIQMGALLTFSAINNNDKVGVVFFSDKVEKYIPPKKGRNHALYIVRELLTETPTRKGTNIQDALKFLSRNNNQRCIAFVMSDFLTEGYENSLKVIESQRKQASKFVNFEVLNTPCSNHHFKNTSTTSKDFRERYGFLHSLLLLIALERWFCPF